VVIEDDRVLLILRGNEPLKGQWSIPGGTWNSAETLMEGAARELREETALQVRVMEHDRSLERINFGRGADETWTTVERAQASAISFRDCRFFVQRISGEAMAGETLPNVAWAGEGDLEKFALTPTATRVIRKAFSMARARNNQKCIRSASDFDIAV